MKRAKSKLGNIKKILLIKFLITLILSDIIYADCIIIPYPKIDTLSTGVVEVKYYYTLPDTVIDTFYESALYDTLKYLYDKSNFVAICHVDSVYYPFTPCTTTICIDSYAVNIVIDTSLKGDFKSDRYSFNVRYSRFVEDPPGVYDKSMKDFILFWKDFENDSLIKGFYPPGGCEVENNGIIIENNKIKYIGYYYGMPGVSVDLNYFLQSVGINNKYLSKPKYNLIFNATPNPFKSAVTFYIPNLENNKIKIFNSSGTLIRSLRGNDNIIWNGDDNNGNETLNGIYYFCLNINGKIYVNKILKNK